MKILRNGKDATFVPYNPHIDPDWWKRNYKCPNCECIFKVNGWDKFFRRVHVNWFLLHFIDATCPWCRKEHRFLWTDIYSWSLGTGFSDGHYEEKEAIHVLV